MSIRKPSVGDTAVFDTAMFGTPNGYNAEEWEVG
jgi:hypothetical protein